MVSGGLDRGLLDRARPTTLRVQNRPNVLGFYRHTLAAHGRRSILATHPLVCTQTAGVPDLDLRRHVQRARRDACAWYASATRCKIFYRVTGSSASTAGYSATADRHEQSFAPSLVPEAFLPNATFTISAVGSTTTDTEIYLFDSSGPRSRTTTIPGRSGPPRSRRCCRRASIRRGQNYTPANDLSDAIPPESWLSGPLTRLPDALANGNATTP
jgi:hypothetical protein